MAADDEHDPAFAALPSPLRERIDAALDAALKNNSDGSPARKRRKVAHSPPQGGFVAAGGFIPEEPAAGGFIVNEPAGGGFIRDTTPVAAGGFVADDASDDDEPHTHIPLSLIPTALQNLDLQPDDEDVLSVFRNAASGWRTRGGAGDDPPDALVSRRDWRAVCAALLDTGAGDDEDEDVDMDDDPRGSAQDAEEAPSDCGEEYVGSNGSESDNEGEDGSDDEYREGGGGFERPRAAKASPKKGATRAGRKQGGGGRRAASGTESEDEGARSLTARQKKECRVAFGLFFPEVGEGELDEQRIRIKDITRVAKVLKEKITAEETVEMLEAFSSSGDKSLSLGDFERMMVAAKLA
ncbi:hypothetical protein C8Q78DRAFT_419262 [Trametes maxima]|nr:hypothetical protein C8Q78DRAFT_419262 [Trametes maxima]